jgi:tRNA G18 (ribose-2'-O)-methylase SpoU
MIQIRKCINPQCGIRFTYDKDREDHPICPRCRSDARLIESSSTRLEVEREQLPSGALHIELMLDNIRSAWNVGSLIRSANGAGIACIHLCGITPFPDQPAVIKTSLGAEKQIAWRYHADGVEACGQCISNGFHVWALEGGKMSSPIFHHTEAVRSPLLLVVGNEISGVDPGIIALCDRVVHLPMYGIKSSLNVAVAGGIAIYWLRMFSVDQGWRPEGINLRR